MFPRSNHHHPRQRSNSLPQVAGQIRPRSPDATNSEVSEDAAANLRTKSPHTERVVKRGRPTGPQHPEASAATRAAHLSNVASGYANHPNPLARPLGLSTLLPAPLAGVVADHLTHLESLLDSILATVVIIQSVSTTPTIPISSHAQDALRLLHNLIPPALTPANASTLPPEQRNVASKAPTCKSYAQAAHTARPSPAGQLSHTRIPPKGPRPSHARHSPHRLIVRWLGHPIPTTSVALDKFVRYLNESVAGGRSRGTDPPRRIAGANVTKTGNLVIHTAAPFTATQLREYSDDIRDNSSLIPGFDPPVTCVPEFELDVPWHGIVIHDLPAVSLIAAYEGDRGDDNEALGLWEALEKEVGIPQANIRDVRVLCPDGEQGKRERLSLRVMLENPLTCDHLCQNSVFLLGMQCRVSRYRPRRKPPTIMPTPRPTSP